MGDVARIEYRHGDATQPVGPGRKLIVHVCDELGSWGDGFTRSLSRRWKAPEEAFRVWARGDVARGEPFALGHVQFVQVEPDIAVANVLAKHGTHSRNGQPALSYDALAAGLRRVAAEALGFGLSVHMPRIASDAGDGRWDVIAALIEQNLCRKGVPVTVYDRR